MLTLTPITLAEANAFITLHHRHHKPMPGAKFCLAVADADVDTHPQQVKLRWEAVCRAIRNIRPRWLALENVTQYRTSDSFAAICRTLTTEGYAWDCWNLMAADWGVPQTRRRLILLAEIDGRKPIKPRPTHQDRKLLNLSQGLLFGDALLPWNGWYRAVEDLLPGLSDTRFPSWQLKRLPETMIGRALLVPGREIHPDDSISCRSCCSPSITVTGSHPPKAFLVSTSTANSDNPDTMPIREAAEPVEAILAGTNHQCRAFLVDEGNGGRRPTSRSADAPAFTLPCYSVKHPPPSAFLVDCMDNDGGDLTLRTADEPAYTMTGSGARRPARAGLACGRVVKLSPRCVARFQSCPDTYKIPPTPVLAYRIIGNGVPCLLSQRVIESLIGHSIK